MTAELEALRRHAHEVPPHGGAADRSDLAERIAQLEAELARSAPTRTTAEHPPGGAGR